MNYFVGIDLHSNNCYLVVIDGEGKVLFKRRLPNELKQICEVLLPFRSQIEGIVVESTYNWYWLVDGLMETGYKVHLANTAAIQQYNGLKHADDKTDARWLAEMLRLGILPEGHIYRKEERPLRDLLRKRMWLVRQHVRNQLAVKGMYSRASGRSISGNQARQLTQESVAHLFEDELSTLAAQSNVIVMHCLGEQINKIEKVILKRMRPRQEFQQLQTVNGIGKILAMTISLEVGDIQRFPSAGNFASYCRCVQSKRTSNQKRKGKGNSKNGNKFLAWAFVEASAFAVRYSNVAKKYYQRKAAKTHMIVARKAVASKLAKACFYIMRDNVPFDEQRAFAT
jgi:transposase